MDLADMTLHGSSRREFCQQRNPYGIYFLKIGLTWANRLQGSPMRSPTSARHSSRFHLIFSSLPIALPFLVI